MPDRRVRPLHGDRAQLRQACREVFALVIERRRRPGLGHHVEGLGHALAGVVAAKPVADELVLVEDRAATHADVEAPAGEVVEQRQLGCEPHRLPQRHLDHGKADADALGAHGERGGERNGVRVDALAREVVLGEPDPVKARRLGKRGLLELLEDRARVVLRRRGVCERQPAESHETAPPASGEKRSDSPGAAGRGSRAASSLRIRGGRSRAVAVPAPPGRRSRRARPADTET